MRAHLNSTITCIQRVENGMQYDSFKVQRKNIAMDITKASGTVSPGMEDQFVKWLFHGTKQETIEDIVNSQATGYLPMLAGSVVGAIWGNGTLRGTLTTTMTTLSLKLTYSQNKVNGRCCSTG
jgi:hypothetical protein